MENQEVNNKSRNNNNNQFQFQYQYQNSEKKKVNNRSMSDTESQTSQVESFHSPLRSDDLEKSPSKAIVVVDKYYSPLRSPSQKPPDNLSSPAVKSNSPVVIFNRAVREDLGPAGTKVEDGVGGERRSRAAVASILRRPRREVALERAALGFRVCEMILCLISFSVMAADKTQGWSGDSFDRYKEYRYCLSVTVIGFVYSGFQAYDLAYHSITGKHVFSHHFRYHFDFFMDQILAYLLISASSSAATRVDDWVSNWGKDEFTEMASASVGMSFLAFAAFALSSLISGYNLCNLNSM